MSPTYLRDLENQLRAARETQREALEDWRALTDYGRHASALFTVSVRVAVATHNAEALADEFEDALADAQRGEIARMREETA